RPLRRRSALMDFAWDAETEALRAEVRAFLAANFTAELDDELYVSGTSHHDGFVRALGERNWIAPEWPREGYEPLGLSGVHVLTEELTRVDAPIIGSSTSTMVGRVI